MLFHDDVGLFTEAATVGAIQLGGVVLVAGALDGVVTADVGDPDPVVPEVVDGLNRSAFDDCCSDADAPSIGDLRPPVSTGADMGVADWFTAATVDAASLGSELAAAAVVHFCTFIMR